MRYKIVDLDYEDSKTTKIAYCESVSNVQVRLVSHNEDGSIEHPALDNIIKRGFEIQIQQNEELA